MILQPTTGASERYKYKLSKRYFITGLYFRSDSGSESSEQSSPQGRTCRRKNGTAAVKNDILNKKKKSRKSYNRTPPTSGSESSEGFKPSEE